MGVSKGSRINWKNIVKRHCDLYFPAIAAYSEKVGKQIALIVSKDAADERRIESFYLCPFCIVNFAFIEDGIHKWNTDFDMDHYPPESVGGTKKILVCKQCNGDLGRLIDYSLKEYHEYIGFEQNETSVKAKISFNNLVGSYNVELRKGDDKTLIFTDFKKNSFLARQLRDMAHTMDLSSLPFDFKFRTRIPPENKIERAILKAGYLYFFAEMGYEFAFSHVGRRLNQVIRGEAVHILSNNGVLKNLYEEHPTEEGLYMLLEPNEYRCFFVIIKTQLKGQKEHSYHMVLIPAHIQDYWHRLRLFEVWDREKAANFVAVRLSKDIIKEAGVLPYSRLSELYLQ